ncbi:TPA: hypothetical protein OT801_003420 [Morganella morganii]|uniref:hypothetical protein n=1 Tax=Morganella morganii TaxID=582 RepID=UPI0007878C51|nr:hypothetical protein [Morganella morganii]EME8471861.1 hypothetical protein [Morganella morganii]QXO39265.1 hypothetical protein JL661_00405 [Morganella morganii]WQD67700.1 hypothetical protein U0006_00405 [Morganella morganii]VDY36184.1 Uncharacterised protein [Morganella morganii]HCT7709324.1 hypothetical protein [Morganella morganii]
MNMRSESKEIYGVSVFPVLAVLHQTRRWWVLRDLKDHWNSRHKVNSICRRHGWDDLIRFQNIERQYFMTRATAKRYQSEGVI